MLLPFDRPYHAAWVTTFLAGRAIAGLESVHGLRYRRRLAGDVWVEAELTDRGLRVDSPGTGDGVAAQDRWRRLFDLDAPATVIDAHLAEHPDLAERVGRVRGLRVPGFWDAFEGAVRAILGQQVSVRRATVLAATLCERFGGGLFPRAEVLACADVVSIGMPGTRGRAVEKVAERVADEGDAWLTRPDTLRSGFADIPGVGPWTTEYAAMRVARDPDAFPDTDWGVFKALGCKGRAAREWAAPCRPWRAYATMLLWATRES